MWNGAEVAAVRVIPARVYPTAAHVNPTRHPCRSQPQSLLNPTHNLQIHPPMWLVDKSHPATVTLTATQHVAGG